MRTTAFRGRTLPVAVALSLAVSFALVGCDDSKPAAAEDLARETLEKLCEGRDEADIVMDRADNVLVFPPAGLRVSFRVRRCDGTPVPSLTSDNITVWNQETGRKFDDSPESGSVSSPLLPTDSGIFVALLLDFSGSIHDHDRYGDVLDAAEQFVESMASNAPDSLRVSLVGFGKEAIEFHGYDDDISELDAVFAELRTNPVDLESTDLYDPYIDAISEIAEKGRELEIVERFVVVVTDGTHESGNKDALRRKALDTLGRWSPERSITVYSVAIRGDYDEDAVKELASSPDESFFSASSSSELADVFRSVADLVTRVAKQNYGIGICTPVKDGSPELKIRVEVDDVVIDRVLPYGTANFDGSYRTKCCADDIVAAVPACDGKGRCQTLESGCR